MIIVVILASLSNLQPNFQFPAWNGNEKVHVKETSKTLTLFLMFILYLEKSYSSQE